MTDAVVAKMLESIVLPDDGLVAIRVRKKICARDAAELQKRLLNHAQSVKKSTGAVVSFLIVGHEFDVSVLDDEALAKIGLQRMSNA